MIDISSPAPVPPIGRSRCSGRPRQAPALHAASSQPPHTLATTRGEQTASRPRPAPECSSVRLSVGPWPTWIYGVSRQPPPRAFAGDCFSHSPPDCSRGHRTGSGRQVSRYEALTHFSPCTRELLSPM
nr:unnamed protein product [Callosobruchus chinensis]